MNDFDLEKALELCVHREREATAEVLRYLREIEARQLHLARGYSSLFTYCMEKLGYSETEADLRIKAMRLIRAVPEAEGKIEAGELSLTVAAQIQRAARREALNIPETRQLVADLSGSSKREAETKLAILFPETPRPERTRPISENHVEIRFTVTAEEAALIQELLDKRAHSNYERRYEKLVMDLVRKELKEPAKAAPLRFPEKLNRHIPAPTRRQVWNRDQGRCQYIDPVTQRRCNARHGIQLDHIKPYSQGGNHSPENLRLYCGAHNRWRTKDQSELRSGTETRERERERERRVQ